MSDHARITELGCPGHLIVAGSCRWRRHTQVGDRFRVSTVGDYFPTRDGKRVTLGAGGQYFESMVFATSPHADADSEECGCREVAGWDGLEARRYATAGEAQRGHEALVAKYAAMIEEPADV